MKKVITALLILIVAMTILLISIVFTLQASACEINSGKYGINSNFNYNNVAYKTLLPLTKMAESKNFDISKGDFPVEFSKILQVGWGLTKKIDVEAKWSVESVGLYKYNYSNCVYWYYQINYRSNNPGNQYVYLNIGLNGEEPDIYKINEVLIN